MKILFIDRIKFLFKFLVNFLIFLSAFFFITSFIWFKFVRERLPKEIPFDLTYLTLFALISVCLLYLFTILNLSGVIKKNNKAFLLLKIYEKIIENVKILDEKIKSFVNIRIFIIKSIKKFLYYRNLFQTFLGKKHLIYKNDEAYTSYLVLIFLFQIIPRIIFIIFLLFDVFYLKNVNYFYSFLPLFSLIIIFEKYILYSFKECKNYLIEYMISIIIEIDKYDGEAYLYTHYIGPDDNPFFVSQYPIKKFISIQTEEFIYKGVFYEAYPRNYKEEYDEAYKKRNNIPKEAVWTFKDTEERGKEFHYLYNILIHIDIFITLYELFSNFNIIKNVKILLFSFIFFAWFYVLLISTPSLHGTIFEIEIIKFILSAVLKIESAYIFNPFV